MMVQGVWSDDHTAQLESTTQFRKLLSIGMTASAKNLLLGNNPGMFLTVDLHSVYLCAERSPPIDEVIKAGVVPRFVEFLGRHDLPQLQVGTLCSFNFMCK